MQQQDMWTFIQAKNDFNDALIAAAEGHIGDKKAFWDRADANFRILDTMITEITQSRAELAELRAQVAGLQHIGQAQDEALISAVQAYPDLLPMLQPLIDAKAQVEARWEALLKGES